MSTHPTRYLPPFTLVNHGSYGYVITHPHGHRVPWAIGWPSPGLNVPTGTWDGTDADMARLRTWLAGQVGGTQPPAPVPAPVPTVAPDPDDDSLAIMLARLQHQVRNGRRIAEVHGRRQTAVNLACFALAGLLSVLTLVWGNDLASVTATAGAPVLAESAGRALTWAGWL